MSRARAYINESFSNENIEAIIVDAGDHAWKGMCEVTDNEALILAEELLSLVIKRAQVACVVCENKDETIHKVLNENVKLLSIARDFQEAINSSNETLLKETSVRCDRVLEKIEEDNF